jgi:hypothetical protein
MVETFTGDIGLNTGSHLEPKDGGSVFLQNVGVHQD